MDLDALLADNPFCRKVGIRYPIAQAGMFQVAYGRLAGAVSAAGGLGVIGSAFMTGEELAREIAIAREMTKKPLGVDILFARVPAEDGQAAAYTAQVAEHIEVTLNADVQVLVSGLGNPAEVIPAAHERGMTVMALVGTSRQAARVAEAGVDLVIASGHEGGGHVGRVGTMALVPKVVDTVDVPVLAAGGLVDGRGLLAALALGAAGVWMGTRFIATDEARGHANYKNKIAEIDEDGTIVSLANSGKPNRMIKNGFTAAWAGRDDEILPYPRQMIEVGAPASHRGRIEGDVENGILAAGQGAGLIGEVAPAGEIVARIMAEMEAALRPLGTAFSA